MKDITFVYVVHIFEPDSSLGEVDSVWFDEDKADEHALLLQTKYSNKIVETHQWQVF